MQVMTVIGSGAEALARTIAPAERIDVLAPGHAVDLYFTGAPPRVAGNVDVVVQPAEARRKKLLLADMESTIIENEMLDELADFLGLKDEVAEITRKAMNDELDFTAALDARVALLRGLDAAVLDRAAGRIRIMPGAAELVATMRANGAVCV